MTPSSRDAHWASRKGDVCGPREKTNLLFLNLTPASTRGNSPRGRGG
jgi:hypothetical protein